MNDQGKASMVRGIALGLAGLGLAGLLAGCGGTRGVKGGGTAQALTSAIFAVEFAATGPGDEAVSITPEDGDAWLVSAPDGSSKIEWSADQKFGIKFVEIDDQTKEQKNKFSKKQSAGWNEATFSAGKWTLSLPLDAGTTKPHKKKEIRGAKYIVASPSGCSDVKPTPAPDCKWQDPVIIVRY